MKYFLILLFAVATYSMPITLQLWCDSTYTPRVIRSTNPGGNERFVIVKSAWKLQLKYGSLDTICRNGQKHWYFVKYYFDGGGAPLSPDECNGTSNIKPDTIYSCTTWTKKYYTIGTCPAIIPNLKATVSDEIIRCP